MNLVEEIITFICDPPASDAAFETLALNVFAFQFEHNRLYQAYCEARGMTPKTVRRWEEIPAVPTRALKAVDLICGPAEKVFLTSGTTEGLTERGRHGFPRLALYDASALTNFAAHLLPDLSHLPDRRIMTCALMLPPERLPESSLAYMIDLVIRAFGERRSGYYIKESGLDFHGLTKTLRDATEAGLPVLLLGPTSGFVHFFEACKAAGLRFILPVGSRIMDTGGTKGIRGRGFTRDTFYAACADLLGITAERCVNEYGMTEMGSQFYDHILRSQRLAPRYKTIPHWVRTRILDPETLDPVRPGTVGILCHLDLANAGSVIAVLTEDLGITIEDGFEIIGRTGGGESRGCSLALDEFLARAGRVPTPT